MAGEGRKAPPSSPRPEPVPDPVVEAAFARVRDGKPMKPRDLVTRLAKRGKQAEYDVLLAEGVLQAREVKVDVRTPRQRATR